MYQNFKEFIQFESWVAPRRKFTNYWCIDLTLSLEWCQPSNSFLFPMKARFSWDGRNFPFVSSNYFWIPGVKGSIAYL